jgi:exodeoxyribonuclease V alpha subunit
VVSEEVISGTIRAIVFYNADNGYCVLRLGRARDTVTAVGSLPGAREGLPVDLTGAWKTHPRFGEQFAFTSYEQREPGNAGELELFRASGVIKGIGPKTARLIVEKFGEASLEVLEKEPAKLKSIEGIGEKKSKQIAESYREHKEFGAVVLHFQQYGIPPQAAMKFYREYGVSAVTVVNENPYRLVSEVYGIGFKTADQIAMRLGFAENSEKRIKSAVLYLLRDGARRDGSTCLPRTLLLERAVKLIDVMSEEVEDAVFSLVLEGLVYEADINGVPCLFPAVYFEAEREVCADLMRLMQSINIQPLEDRISELQTRKGLALSEEQAEAVRQSLLSGVFVLTGGPGTGKTTIMGAILDILTHEDEAPLVAAPTGRAAKRIQETTGYPAVTIHRLLEYTYGEDDEQMMFGRTRENPLGCKNVIIDEASMVDVLLMRALTAAIPDGARLILVGDADQLPPVGAGNVLRDILDSGRVPSFHLTEIFRQAAQSMITVNAHRINRGEMPVVNEADSDFFILRREEEERILQGLLDLITTRLPAKYGELDPLRDMQVLTPVKRGILGNRSLNAQLQQLLNPPSHGKAERKFGERTFRTGDKVMQMRNNYGLSWKSSADLSEGEGVFNGDIGFVRSIDPDMGTVTVVFDEVRHVVYDGETLEDLDHAYAVTVHKSQGSEFPIILMPVFPVPPMLASRNLLYTAVTRGKRLVVLVGRERVLEAMVENSHVSDRYSGLRSFLEKYADI